jgi:hypothetical protein
MLLYWTEIDNDDDDDEEEEEEEEGDADDDDAFAVVDELPKSAISVAVGGPRPTQGLVRKITPMVAKIAVLPRRITDVVGINEGEDEEEDEEGDEFVDGGEFIPSRSLSVECAIPTSLDRQATPLPGSIMSDVKKAPAGPLVNAVVLDRNRQALVRIAGKQDLCLKDFPSAADFPPPLYGGQPPC